MKRIKFKKTNHRGIFIYIKNESAFLFDAHVYTGMCYTRKARRFMRRNAPRR